jgi:hypothetical protein
MAGSEGVDTFKWEENQRDPAVASRKTQGT